MDPLTWIWLAAMAASTGANYMAQRKVDNDTSKVNAEARERREKQQRDSERLTMDSANLYTGTPGKEDARAAELAAQYAKTAPEPTTGPHGTSFLANTAPTQSTATIEETRAQLDKANANVARRGAADAKLRAFGDVMGENSIQAGRNSQDIGQGASFVNSWQQNVMPALLAKANLAGRDWATAADVMKLAGAVMQPWALTNGSGGGAETTQGVLERMGGTPAEFAGRDLFGMAKKFGPGQSFGGAGFAMDEQQQQLIAKQMMGLPLTEAERELLARKF